jgi:hypothetical protein
MTIRQTAILTDIVGFDAIGVPQQAIEGIPYDNGYRKKKPSGNPFVRFGFHDTTLSIITLNMLWGVG